MSLLFSAGAESGELLTTEASDDGCIASGNVSVDTTNQRDVQGIGGGGCYKFSTSSSANGLEWTWPNGVEADTRLEFALKSTGNLDTLRVEYLLGSTVVTTVLFSGSTNTLGFVTVYKGTTGGTILASASTWFKPGFWEFVHIDIDHSLSGFIKIYTNGNLSPGSEIAGFLGDTRGPSNEIPDAHRIYGSGPYYLDDLVFSERLTGFGGSLKGSTLYDALPVSENLNQWDLGSYTDLNTYAPVNDLTFCAQNDGSPANLLIQLDYTPPVSGVLSGVIMMARVGSDSPTTDPDRFQLSCNLGGSDNTGVIVDPIAFEWVSHFIDDDPSNPGVPLTIADVSSALWRLGERN